MGHRWLSTDNGSQCYRCGLVIEYRTESELGGDFAEDFPGASDLAHGMAPDCSGPATKRAHHLVLAIHPASNTAYYLECAYGDASGDEPSYIADPECSGPDARPDMPELYGPDGVPLDGPRTTAHVWAGDVAHDFNRRHGRHDRVLWGAYRNAAADEGSRYSEAIAGARAMREARVSRWMIPPTHPTWACELARGIPNDNRLTR